MTAATTDLDRELDEMAHAELNRDARPATPAMSVRSPDQVFPDHDRNLAVGVHLGTLAALVFSGGFLHVLVPLIAFFVAGDRSDAFKQHVKGQLNFQITFVLAAVASVLGTIFTFGLGLVVAIPLIVFLFLTDIWCSVRAALAASRGEEYEFPFTLPLIR
jgi:hypothetical protein